MTITIKEHQEINEAIQSIDAQFTDDIIDKAEYYDIEEDEVILMTTVTIYDVNGGVLTTANVEDYDTAYTYMEDMFDLEPLDDEEVDPDAAAINSRYGHNA
jgi:hypothetical protein